MSSIPFPDTPEAKRAGAVLTVDLGAIQSNWRTCQTQAGGVETAAVIKADGYGLGAMIVGPALMGAGCKTFFVATIDEGIDLRHALGPDAAIHVLAGVLPDTVGEFSEHGLIPVLNTPDQIAEWRGHGGQAACDIHLDTGMSRLGLSPEDAAGADFAGLSIAYVMSHLVSSEEQDNPINAEQLTAFTAARARLPGTKASLANSSGVFLGADFHFDLVRPGAALYGINPLPGQPNPMAQVVRLQGKIVQVRSIDTPQSVGYGATHKAQGAERIATVSVGYADGYPRALSNRGRVLVGGVEAAIVGRVSMDLITIDVTDVPQHLAQPGLAVDLIAPGLDADRVGEMADTIGYEVLTHLGKRYHRVYTGG